MTIRHHPDDLSLIAYAAGTLTEGMSLVVAAHLELCPQCRGRVREAQGLGGVLLDGIEISPVSDTALAATLARIDAIPAPASNSARTPAPRPRIIGALPATLAPWLPAGLDRVPWRTLAPGIRHFRFPGLQSGGGTVRLLAIAPGTALPHHGHGGTEMTLVLHGSFADEVGRFQSGDLADLDPSIQHQPVADTDTHCVCLIATDARLRFTGVLGRMLQPLVGF